MKYEKLLACVCAERNELDADVQLLRLQNLALSAKLEEQEAVTRNYTALAADNARFEKKLEAVQAELSAIKKAAKCFRLEHIIGNIEQRSSEIQERLVSYEVAAALQIQLKKLEASRGEIVIPQHDLPAEAAKVLRDHAWDLMDGSTVARGEIVKASRVWGTHPDRVELGPCWLLPEELSDQKVVSEEIVQPEAQCSGPFSDAHDCPVQQKQAYIEASRGEIVKACPPDEPWQDPDALGNLQSAATAGVAILKTCPECDHPVDGEVVRSVGWNDDIVCECGYRGICAYYQRIPAPRG